MSETWTPEVERTVEWATKNGIGVESHVWAAALAEIRRLREERLFYLAERDRLAAVVERLPTTADGVYLIPTVDWCYHPINPREPLSPSLSDSIDDERDGWVAMSEWEIDVGGMSKRCPLVSECYSTEAAARAAQPKGQSDE